MRCLKDPEKSYAYYSPLPVRLYVQIQTLLLLSLREVLSKTCEVKER